jgi:polysaccharide biosynthesis protein PslH
MRLIYVVPFCPYPPQAGVTIRFLKTIEALGRRNELHVIVQDTAPSPAIIDKLQPLVASLTFVPNAESPKARRQSGERAAMVRDAFAYPPSFLRKYRSDAVVERIRRLVEGGEQTDWIFLDTQMSGQMILSPDLPRVPTVLCLHDLYHDYFGRKVAVTPLGPYKLKFALDQLKARHYEARLARRFDLVCVTSAHEQEAVQRRAGTARTIVVPNGVDLEYFQPVRGLLAGAVPTVPKCLLFVGNYAYEPNVDAVRYFLDEIWPLIKAARSETEFVAAGTYPPAWLRARAEQDPFIVVPGALEDLRPLYEGAGVAVVPLRLGGGTKLKVLEAMAMGVPVVTTPGGANGIEARDGEHFLVARDPADFAAQVLRILEHPSSVDQLRRRARELVVRSYGWPAILESFEEQLRAGRKVVVRPRPEPATSST